MASKSMERKTPENFAKEATNSEQDEDLTEGKRPRTLAARKFQRNSGNTSENAAGVENAISCLPLLAWQGAGKNNPRAEYGVKQRITYSPPGGLTPRFKFPPLWAKVFKYL